MRQPRIKYLRDKPRDMTEKRICIYAPNDNQTELAFFNLNISGNYIADNTSR